MKSRKQSKALLLLALVLGLLSSCTKSRVGIIHETIHIRHKGADMPAYVHGNSEEKTFLIVLHGAGSYGLAFRDGAFTSYLEENYVVVYFDQRGVSMSEGHYSKPDDLVSLMVEDVQALTNVIKTRYGDDSKLFIMGHSWGGLLSAATILTDDFQYNFQGWINVAGLLDVPSQNQARKELIMLISDEHQALSENADSWIALRDEAENTDDYDELLDLAKRTIQLLSKDEIVNSTITTEKIYQAIIANNPINFISSNFFNKPVNAVIGTDFSLLDQMENIDIPSLHIYGKYDVSVPPSLGLSAFSKIEQEEKEFTTFEKSIHHPYDTEPDRFGQSVIEFIQKHK